MDQKILCCLVLFIFVLNLIQAKPNSCSVHGCGKNGCSIFVPRAELKKANLLFEKHHQKPNKHYHMVQENSRVLAENLDHFDARQKWPDCTSIGDIYDQSICESCYAVATASAISDRVCIATYNEEEGNKMRPRISASELLSCCYKCSDVNSPKDNRNGCKPGRTPFAWDYWKDVGLVTGGKYGSTDTCLPYDFPSCQGSHPHPDCHGKSPENLFQTQECPEECIPSYNELKGGGSVDDIYFRDRYYGKNPKCLLIEELGNDMEKEMKKELHARGSITIFMNIFDDFRYRYQAGEIYEIKSSSKSLGSHTVKFIGWGKENGKKYWLGVSSWGEDWGDNGVFKVTMDQEKLKIMDQVCFAEFDKERTLRNMMDDD